jgi:hypothetical protein
MSGTSCIKEKIKMVTNDLAREALSFFFITFFLSKMSRVYECNFSGCHASFSTAILRNTHTRLQHQTGTEIGIKNGTLQGKMLVKADQSGRDEDL